MGKIPMKNKYIFAIMAAMQKSSTVTLSVFVITTLVLVPVLQSLPLNLPLLLPDANAQGYSLSLNKTQSTSGTASNTITLSNFNAGIGINPLLVVAVEANNNSVNSITFGGASLTKVVGSFHNDYTAFWFLKNPRGTGNIVVTMAGPSQVVAGAYLFSGVDQANPIPTTATNFTQANSPIQPNPHISLTTEYSNSYVLDSPSLYGGSTLSSPSCTQAWNINIANKITGASSYKTQASAGKVTCTWTNSVSGNGWDDAAIEIKAAGTAAPSTPIILNGKSTASGFVGASGGSATIYNFNPGTGANRLLVVGVEQDWQSVNSITFGGVALTKKVSSFVNNDAEFWYLTNPSVTPANLVITMSGGSRISTFVIGAYAFSGVDQANPLPDKNLGHNTSTTPTISITTSNANELVLDSPSIFGGASLSAPTCNQQWNSNVQYNSTQKITLGHQVLHLCQ